MLKFPKSYYREEIISGFLVESEMKSAWAAQLEVYKLIEDICVRHGLKMFGIWGTMLGAVRHNGFIPWDDDFDIGMLREDYDKFWEYAMQELPDGYNLFTPALEPEWDLQLGRVVNTNKMTTSSEWLEKYHGCTYAIGIDIFPFDYVPNDSKTRDWVLSILDLIAKLIPLAWTNTEHKFENEELIAGLKLLEDTFGFEFFMEGNVQNQLRCLYDVVCSSYGNENDDLICFYPIYVESKGNHVFHKKWFETIVPVNYENTTMLMPIGYDPILYISYGENYMFPIKGTSMHDYPFYKGQREHLINVGMYDKLLALRGEFIESSCDDNEVSRTDNIKLLPVKEEWKAGLLSQDRKVILYAFNAGVLFRYGEKLLSKIERNIKFFAEHKNEVMVIWAEDDMFYDTLKAMYPKSVYKYDMLKAKVRKECNGIVSDRINYDFESVCDAYYGHGTAAMGPFLKAKKPIMIENINV